MPTGEGRSAAATTTHRLYELDARAETRVGEPAPDFELSRLDSPDERVRLTVKIAVLAVVVGTMMVRVGIVIPPIPVHITTAHFFPAA